MKKFAASLLALAALSGSASAAVVISSGATSHMNCSAGVCTPTSKNAVLNVSQLEGLLASSDVTVNTGSGAVTIAVSAPLTWASTSRLTLDASQGVSIKAAVVVEGTAGLTITPSGGALNFYPGGSVTFWDNASSLIIAGNAYTLVSDLPTLASDTTADPSGFFAFAKDPPPAPIFNGGVVLTPFGGTFEGLGHTVNRIVISASATGPSGIFARTNLGSTVRDLNVTRASMACGSDSSDNGLVAGFASGEIDNVTVQGTMNCFGTNIGGLVGLLDASGRITHSSAQVKVGGHFTTGGGLVGMSDGNIDNSSASGRVGGGHNAFAGGLVGLLNNGNITDSHATGAVFVGVGQISGGLVGVQALGTIERCYATGAVTARNVAGGLVGQSDDGHIDSSFSTGSVQAVRFSGGLLGWGKGHTMLTNTYATGAVTETGGGQTGGLVGRFEGTSIATSWSSGAVSGPNATAAGGFVGMISAHTPVSAAYWDLDTSGISDPSRGAGGHPDFPGITGLTTAQFQSGLPAGFDPSVWAENAGINNGYPYLIANPPQ